MKKSIGGMVLGVIVAAAVGAVLAQDMPSVTPVAQMTFTLDGQSPTRILFCDLEGGIWRVECDGREIHAGLPVAMEEGCLSFAGGPGHYQVKRISLQPGKHL